QRLRRRRLALRHQRLVQPRNPATAAELAWMAPEQPVQRGDEHLRVARARQPPAGVAQRRILAREPLLSELRSQDPRERPQPLERLARLVHRPLVRRRPVAPAAEQPDREIELAERYAPEAEHRRLAREQRE